MPDRLSCFLSMLGERFAAVTHDGPIAYGAFLAGIDDEEGAARLRQEAVAVVREFLRGLAGATP